MKDDFDKFMENNIDINQYIKYKNFEVESYGVKRWEC